KTDNDMPAFWFDPLMNLAAIAQVTHHIGLVAPISSTFSNPFTAARQLLSLDHMSQGRAGGNLVTSMTDLEAAKQIMTSVPTHHQADKEAELVASVMNQIITSWRLEDVIHDKTQDILINANHNHAINHTGERFKVQRPLTTQISLQGKPVAMQAGV